LTIPALPFAFFNYPSCLRRILSLFDFSDINTLMTDSTGFFLLTVLWSNAALLKILLSY
jgi:hypothetical protein